MGCFLSNGKVKVDREEATTVEDKSKMFEQIYLEMIVLIFFRM